MSAYSEKFAHFWSLHDFPVACMFRSTPQQLQFNKTEWNRKKFYCRCIGTENTIGTMCRVHGNASCGHDIRICEASHHLAPGSSCYLI